jgi:hypothetical protein
MRVVCLLVRPVRPLFMIAGGLVVVAVRRLAVVVGGLLVLVGVVGGPAWLIQLVISLLGGGAGGGRLGAGTMCLLMLAAVPIGLLLMSAASTPGPLSRPSADRAGAVDVYDDQQQAEVKSAGWATSPTDASKLAISTATGLKIAGPRLARHQLRLRIASRSMARVGLRRGVH